MVRVTVLAAEGLTVRDIANELGMSKSTVQRLQAKGKAPGAAPTGHD